MEIVVRPASVALLLTFALGVADAIRYLKEGPVIDAEGREYKSSMLKGDAEIPRPLQLIDDTAVHVQCTETSMIVEVKADLYKIGHHESPGEFFLGEAVHSGSSRCRALPSGDGKYVIEAKLQDCGSNLTVFEDSVVYSNKLVFSPASRYHGIMRLTHAVIPVSCHYKRTHLVSSNLQLPHLTYSASSQHPAFSLTLMTDDWTSERSFNVFNLGDILRLQASYEAPDSGRRRLFIDNCVATLSPDALSVPRYYFIENHGCFTDAKQGGVNPLFQQRQRSHLLQLQLDAFLFHKDSRNSIFITCQLKVTSNMWESSPINKACNYVNSRWKNVDGNDHVCRCCDSTCYRSSPLRNKQPSRKDILTCSTVAVGPLMIEPSK